MPGQDCQLLPKGLFCCYWLGRTVMRFRHEQDTRTEDWGEPLAPGGIRPHHDSDVSSQDIANCNSDLSVNLNVAVETARCHVYSCGENKCDPVPSQCDRGSNFRHAKQRMCSYAINCRIHIKTKTALFWLIAQRAVAIACRRFGATYRSRIQGSRRPFSTQHTVRTQINTSSIWHKSTYRAAWLHCLWV